MKTILSLAVIVLVSAPARALKLTAEAAEQHNRAAQLLQQTLKAPQHLLMRRGCIAVHGEATRYEAALNAAGDSVVLSCGVEGSMQEIKTITPAELSAETYLIRDGQLISDGRFPVTVPMEAFHLPFLNLHEELVRVYK